MPLGLKKVTAYPIDPIYKSEIKKIVPEIIPERQLIHEMSCSDPNDLDNCDCNLVIESGARLGYHE